MFGYRRVFGVLIAAGAALPVLADAPTLKPLEFFEKRVRPILVNRCYDCHSGDDPENGLQLDSLAGMLRGGDLGPAIVPGKPQQSLLISAINHGELLKMPPKEKLPTAELVALTAWVKMGAPWPNAKPLPVPKTRNKKKTGPLFTQEQKSFWLFQPPVDPDLPAIRNTDWPKSPLDSFVLARLEAAGFPPAPPADKRMLIRRATFDLIGLPPSPEEIDAFLADDSPGAFARLVDRLLSSPHYGERWGRHWLDVARYADSNGLDENLSYANAYHYRDYVIGAFNSDKPYNRFVQEQLAGDLLPATGDEQADFARVIATGFLALGAKMLAEDDPVKMQMDIIDEQVGTLSMAFMGLTMGCARCHDHKFDPLTMADYYSLVGIFKSTKTMENFKVVAVWFERPLETPEARQKRVAFEKRLAGKRAQIKSASGKDKDDTAEVRVLKKELAELEKSRPNTDKAMGVTEGKIGNVRIHLRGSHLTLGEEVPRVFPRIISGEGQTPIDDTQSGRLQLAKWLTTENHPLTSRVMVNRIWHWHFGTGLVRSLDNLGRLGERPTHPRLLDWLARRFVAGGWSIKSLHRAIMLSSTYQMSTRYNAAADKADPQNELYWRVNRRRLEAEEIRDAVLAVGGGLDLKMGGTLLKVKNRAYVTSSGTQITNEYDNARRSVYLPVVRSSVFDVFQTFDFPDPATFSGSRQTSTVAPQALFMMNSQLVSQQTRAMADRLLEQKFDDRQRIDRAYRRALGRRPTKTEINRALEFLGRAEQALASTGIESGERRRQAWRSLCRTIVACNEFVYVE